MSSFVLGIDPSAKKIAVVGRHVVTNTILCQSFILYKGTEKQTIATLGLALDAMNELLLRVDQVAPNGERLAWVEDPLVGRGGPVTTMKQAFVGGIIRATLHNAGFQVYNVNVSTWKKQVCGNGRAQKSDVRRVVKTRWPKVDSLIGSDGDLADAAAIALYGEDCLRRADAISGSTGLVARRMHRTRSGDLVRPTRVRPRVRR